MSTDGDDTEREPSALEHAEALEAENEDLRAELAELREEAEHEKEETKKPPRRRERDAEANERENQKAEKNAVLIFLMVMAYAAVILGAVILGGKK